MSYTRVWTLLVILAGGCSQAGDGNPTTGGFRPDGDTGPRKVGFTGSVVRPERRFAGFSPSASRVSLIDPESEQEVWGKQVDRDYIRAVALPDVSGVALFTSRSVDIVTPSGDRAFPDGAFEGAVLAFSRERATYAAVSLDATGLRIVAALAAGAWQDESFSLPWPSSSPSNAGSAPSAVAMYNADGTKLLVLSPQDGRFLIYQAADTLSPLGGPALTCTGSSEAVAGQDLFRSMAWDDAAGVVYLGDRHGRVTAVDPASCPDWAARPTVTLVEGAPVTDLNVVEKGVLGVTVAGGKAYLLEFTAGAFAVSSTLGTCAYAVGVADGGDGRLLVPCFALVDFDPITDASTLPATVAYTDTYLQVFGRTDGTLQREIPLPFEAPAGLAIDTARGVMLELRDSALGLLEVTNLSDGAVTTRKGLFLDGILD